MNNTNKLYTHISELIHSDTATVCNINNMPNIQAIDKMQDLIHYVLQPVRLKFGAIHITSGFRCKTLNQKVGGAVNSEHLYGQAADFVMYNLKINLHDVFVYIKDNLEYNQLLFERNSKGDIWVHVSYLYGRNKKQAIDNYYVK